MMSALEQAPNTKFRQFYTTLRCSNLPLELINSIFRQCSRNDLKQCALTCRSWNAAARPIFFSKVEFRSATEVDDLISLVIKDNAIGAFVKEISVRELELDLHSLYLYSKIFKNIESLTFYMNNECMYKRLYELLSVGEFSFLKSISEPFGSSEMEMYLQCINIIKNRMTEIDIFSLKAYESFQRFHTFVKLNTINIEFFKSLLPISAIDLLEGITQKSNLPSLKEIEVVLVNDSRFASNKLISRMDDIQPIFNVSDLKISGYSSRTIIDDTFMRYIIKKFPNLQRLELLSYNWDDANVYCGLPKVGNHIVLSVDVTVEFLEYFSRLSTFDVQHIATEGKTAEIIKKFCSNFHKKKPLDDPPSLDICYNKVNGDELDLIYPVVSMNSAQTSKKRSSSILVALNPLYDPVFNNGQEERRLITCAGQYFTKIVLDGIPTFSLRVLLTNIARHCTNLKVLMILNSSDLLDETAKYDDLVVNHSLTHLMVETNVKCPNLLSLISCMFAGLEWLWLSTNRMRIKLPEEKMLAVAMPKLSVSYFQVELSLYYEDYHLNTCSDYRVLVQLDVGEKSRYLLFSNKLLTKPDFDDHFPLKFDREISAFEFEESKKVDENYFVYHVQCKSTKMVSIRYAVGRSAISNFVHKNHQVHF